MTYYVYEYLLIERGHAEVRAVVHQGDCLVCRDGQGLPTNAGGPQGLRRWHGPYATLAAAQSAAQGIGGQALACKRCRPTAS